MLLHKDSASALAVSLKLIVSACTSIGLRWLTLLSQAIGTHAGIIHLIDHSGERVKSYRPHSASVLDLCFDTDADFVASASIDGSCPHPLSSVLDPN